MKKFLIIVLALSLIAVFSESYTSPVKNNEVLNEAKVFSTPTKSPNIDSDKDGYSDLCESLHKSDLQNKESIPKENISINVPSDVKTIQEAINIAIDGDTILIDEGKYKGNINFNGKTITLLSTNPNAPNLTTDTIIEDIQSITFNNAEDVNSVLKELTIIPTLEPKTTESTLKPAKPLPPTVPTQFENSTTTTVISYATDTTNEESIISSLPIAPDEQFNDTEPLTMALQTEDSPIVLLSGPTIWYVDDDAPDTGNGISWENAFKYLQDALINSEFKAGDEILVAGGTYKPDQGNGITVGDRTATFQLVNGVTVKGGFKGGDNITGYERDIKLYPTILSGDVGIPDDATDNSYTVVRGPIGTLDDSALVAHWKFDEDNGIAVDSAGNDNNGTVVGATWTADGKINGALSFDGIDDYVSIDYAENLTPRTNGFTVSAWIKTSDPATRRIYNQRESINALSGMTIYDGKFRGELSGDCGYYNNPPCYSTAIGTKNIADGEWHFVVFSRDIDNKRLYAYVDGDLDGNVPDSTTDVNPLTTFYISDRPSSQGNDGHSPFNGMIDDVRIYNRSLNENEPLETVIDGFTITGGYNSIPNQGGGMLNNSTCLLTISNCIFKNNSVGTIGGGILNKAGSNGTPNVKIINCFFVNNNADNGGGAIYNWGSVIMEATNCVFAGNTGGAIFTYGHSEQKLTNCTFYDNSRTYNGYGCATLTHYYTQPIITNCILRDGGNEIFNGYYDRPTRTICNPIVTYCNIEGGYPGDGNIDADSLFVDAGNPAGTDGIFSTIDDGLRIRINSPCIDSANGDTAPLTDITGLDRIDIANIPNTGTGTPNYADIGACESGHDADSDSMPDEWEVFYSLDPYNPDDADSDIDNDEVTNLWEYTWNTNPANPDTDGDELDDGDEIYTYGTDPTNPDTDNDEMPDGWEVQYGLDPLDPADADEDPDEDDLTNFEEYQHSTDPKHPNPVLVWEKTGLLSPVDVVVDNNRNVYVLESGASQVTIYDKDGTYQTQIVLGASNPRGIDLDDTGNLYIADTGNNRILKMDVVDTELFVFSLDTTFSGDGIAGEYGTGDSQLDQPWAIGVDSEGNVYVTDSGNNRIQKLDSTGEFVDRWGTFGTDDGQFNQPKGIFVDATGNIQIADSGNNRIQEFTSSGSLLNVWESTNLFYQPADLTLNNYYIYVTDAGNNQVQKFDNYNEYITSLTNLGLSNPQGIAIDENLEQELIYIADTGNNRLIKVEIPIISPDETWNDTKVALGTGNIELALENFDEASKERYSQIFTAIEAQLPTIISNMQAIELIYIRGDIAKYRIKREEGGQDITYYIYFNKDENGKWKIRNF